MNTKLIKLFSSCAMAVALSFTSVAAQATEIGNAECKEGLTIESCAANIKRIYSENYPEQAAMINDIVDTISSSEEFACIFEDEGATAFQIIEDSLHDALDPMPTCVAWDGNDDADYYYTKYGVPCIQQTENTFCGVASMLMALIGGGKEEYMSNSALTDKMQYDYAEEVGIYDKKNGITGDGVHIQDMKEFLQARFPVNSANFTYRVKVFTRYSVEDVTDYISLALLCDTVPILRVDEPQRLSYYPDNYNSSAHYVVIHSIDYSTGKVVVIDPHYLDSYYGRHTITIEEVEDLVYSKLDLWMCVYTHIPDEKYVYN